MLKRTLIQKQNFLLCENERNCVELLFKALFHESPHPSLQDLYGYIKQEIRKSLGGRNKETAREHSLKARILVSDGYNTVA